MAAYKVLTVGEKEYKLRLNTNATILIEDKLGENILDGLFSAVSSANIEVDKKRNVKTDKMNKAPMPSLKYCVTILWGALQKFHHGMTFVKTCDLVDEYIEEGKTQFELFAEIMDLLNESGIIPTKEEAVENLK